jgi:tetratricopeptide (TPR) repeat protein
VRFLSSAAQSALVDAHRMRPVRGHGNALLRAFPVGTLWQLACTPPLRAQSTAAAEQSRAASPRQEEMAADALMERGKPREALGELDRAANVYSRAGDRLAPARVILKRSRAKSALGDLEGASRDAEQARLQVGGDSELLLQVLTQVARVATDRSEFPRADAALREALPIAERAGESRD